MDEVMFKTYKGKKILFIDFSKSDVKSYPVVIKEAALIIRKQKKDSLLTLTNVSNSEYMPTNNKKLYEYVRLNRPYVKAAAIVGASGIKRILLRIAEAYSGRRIHSFDKVKDAKDWLVEEKH